MKSLSKPLKRLLTYLDKEINLYLVLVVLASGMSIVNDTYSSSGQKWALVGVLLVGILYYEVGKILIERMLGIGGK